MPTTLQTSPLLTAPPMTGLSHQVFQALLQHEPAEHAMEVACDYLRDRLDEAGRLACDLPEDPNGLAQWMMEHHDRVGAQYLEYLEQRKDGAPRRYFSTRSHALYFLQGVAPTKFVDGSWLYGLLQRWEDDRYHGLIRTYLEELGDGVPANNHVVMYRRLLASNGCEHVRDMADDHYMLGAIQLCLAYHCSRFLPEVIGYNLGYEQLPLHLLITTHELNEWGIDPYYFQVHVTVDNAATGHARKAVEAVQHALPRTGDTQQFYERVRRGYMLNELGRGTVDVIQSFDLQQEVERIVRDKGVHGRHMHSDYCKVAGRTINEWLREPAQTGEFLEALEQQGWIRRHADPAESRFWRLLDGETADMFGVFSPYEMQVLYDWIAGDWEGAKKNVTRTPAGAESFRFFRKKPTSDSQRSPSVSKASEDDFDEELRLLQRNVMQASSKQDAMSLLIDLMGPATHHTPAGLMATRMFSQLLHRSA